MVRLEIRLFATSSFTARKFTFQYGQIRNSGFTVDARSRMTIYIPVWLDQKCRLYRDKSVRRYVFTFQYGQIRN